MVDHRVMDFNLGKKSNERNNLVLNNVSVYERVLNERYLGKKRLPSSFLSSEYKWFGTSGVIYDYTIEKDCYLHQHGINAFKNAFSEITMKNHMLGEGFMVGNYFVVEAVHSGSYYGVEATGNRVSFFGVQHARFNGRGEIVEEWELWDEAKLLSDIGVINEDDNLLEGGIIDINQLKNTLISVEARRTPEMNYVLYNPQCAIPDNRDKNVSRNVRNWLRFTEKKYTKQDLEGLSQVMCNNYKYHGVANLLVDHSCSNDRQSMHDCLKWFMAEFPDINYKSQLFGEGNMALYHVVSEFTHSGDIFGVPASQFPIRSFNLSVGRFGEDGRIAEEAEVHDVVSLYKQLGVFEDKPENSCLLLCLKSIDYIS